MTKELVAIINEAAKNQREDTVAFVEEKFERPVAEVKVEIANVKADLVRWMFNGFY